MHSQTKVYAPSRQIEEYTSEECQGGVATCKDLSFGLVAFAAQYGFSAVDDVRRARLRFFGRPESAGMR